MLNAFEQMGELIPPGRVFARVFPDRRFRRAHFREHAVVGQALDAVAPAQAFDVELAGPAVDFEGEEVLPFGAARVQPGDLARPRF